MHPTCETSAPHPKPFLTALSKTPSYNPSRVARPTVAFASVILQESSTLADCVRRSLAVRECSRSWVEVSPKLQLVGLGV